MALAYQPRDETVGRYRLFARLARGGMAELYVARMIGTGRFEKLVAIKRMLPHLAEDPQFVAMFENEAQIAARLSHPNVCQVYELGVEGGLPFLVMEFLRGLTWNEIVVSLPTDEAIRARFIAGVMFQACEGLNYAHTLVDVEGRTTPIVHRDISPGNLMITTEGVVKILDFGVSKVLTEGGSTRTGMIKGKLPYMAPEQIRGEPVDGRADLFSLGVVVWEAISGKRLFERDSDYQIWKAVTEEPVPRLPLGPLARLIEPVVMRALARTPDQRQPTARAFADEMKIALAPFGAAMSASEIQAQLAVSMRGRLDRDSKDLAFAISQLRLDEAEAARTNVQIIAAPPKAAETRVEMAQAPVDSWSSNSGFQAVGEGIDATAVDEDTEDEDVYSSKHRALPAKIPAGGIALRESAMKVTAPPAPKRETVDDDIITAKRHDNPYDPFTPKPVIDPQASGAMSASMSATFDEAKPLVTLKGAAVHPPADATTFGPMSEAPTGPRATPIGLPHAPAGSVPQRPVVPVVPEGPQSEAATKLIPLGPHSEAPTTARPYTPHEPTVRVEPPTVPRATPAPRPNSAPSIPVAPRPPSGPSPASPMQQPAPEQWPNVASPGRPASGPAPIGAIAAKPPMIMNPSAVPPSAASVEPTTPHVPLTPDERRMVEALRQRQSRPSLGKIAPNNDFAEPEVTKTVARPRGFRFWFTMMLLAIVIGTFSAIALRYL